LTLLFVLALCLCFALASFAFAVILSAAKDPGKANPPSATRTFLPTISSPNHPTRNAITGDLKDSPAKQPNNQRLLLSNVDISMNY
jgi:hypothetical protein